ncbi:uncharacterized protein LOC130815499 [Amaranthus tricolor]|uniref:uncharacterized protein LOC130815499 n=1 Tax=Amaranthus tricolor TaxID=29722 RepID=UPI0025836F84|nr:uncharacterized protein LOC130815499 [Amaranthus tricolor]
MACMEKEDRTEKRVSYKEAKRAAKKAVTEAKNRGHEDLYRKLDTKEGEKQIFKLARTRSRQRQDLEAVKYIKDEGERVLLRQEDIKTKWLQYFSQLLNESRGLKETDNQIFNVQRPLEYGSTSDITREEVGEALKKMGRTKAIGSDNIPIESINKHSNTGGDTEPFLGHSWTTLGIGSKPFHFYCHYGRDFYIYFGDGTVVHAIH